MHRIGKAIWGAIDALARAVIRVIGKVSPKLGALCEKLWNNTELVAYIFAGVGTTLVNYVAYFVLTRYLSLGILPATNVSWVLAVLFGYAVNKAFVFRTHCDSLLSLAREAGSFFAMRAVSLLMENVLMFVTVEVLHLNDLVMKICANFVVLMLNYIFSKLLIFRKK